MPRIAYSVLVAAVLLAPSCTAPQTPESAREVATPPSLRDAQPTVLPAVHLTERQAVELSIETVRLSREAARFPIGAPGSVFPAPENLAIVSAPISGRVVAILKHEGERVQRGEVLLEIESLEFATLAAGYLQASADETYARQQVDRLTELVEKKISPRSALDKAEADLMRATAAVRASIAQMQALGVTEGQLERFSEGYRRQPRLEIRAPISGVIAEHDIDLGQSVVAYQQMLTLVDLSRVLVRGYVSPEDAALVRPGDPVRVTVKDFPGRAVAGQVSTVNPGLDPSSQAVTINILLRPERDWPLPGQSVRVEVEVAPEGSYLVVPLSAIQYEGDRPTVFVRADSLTFERRAIAVSRTLGDAVLVSAGLEEGDEVAVSQVFNLKALARFEQFAED